MRHSYSYFFKQLQDIPGTVYKRFADYKTAQPVDLHRYFTADLGTVEAETPELACEKLYERYNINHPENYLGRSMSVSDVVELWDNNTDPPVHTVWYCDSFGFKQLNDKEVPA